MPPFRCPVCHDTLLTPMEPRQPYRCAQNHSFDPAKAGYLNLLLSQHKKSKQPGDSPEMVKARQDFLEAGYYLPLAEQIAQWVCTQAGHVKGPCQVLEVLDMGCGEGYYLSQVVAKSSSQKIALEISGVDVSKTAVHLAARRPFTAQWAVASVYQLPFFEQSFDVALSVFSPLQPEETRRVLKPGGHLMMVGPGANHLQGLMAEIYTQVHQHQGNPVFQQTLDTQHWEAVACHEIKLSLEVLGADIFNLLTMTPYYWKCDRETQERLRHLSCLQTPAHFELQIYRRVG